ncbi:MAG: hypothetical protein AAB116_15900, partial [Candidatus Poribacteria bacterium]
MSLLTKLKDFCLCVFYKYITPSGLKILNLVGMELGGCFIPLKKFVGVYNMTDANTSEEMRRLIHKLNHNLTLVYSYIDLSVLYLEEELATKEDVIQFLGQAQKTYDEVKDIIAKLSEQASESGSTNE